MNEKEKEAIRQLERCRDFWKEQLEKSTISEEDTTITNKEIEHNTILLNLIDKQNKAINEIKKLETMLMYDKYEDTYKEVICKNELDEILEKIGR